MVIWSSLRTNLPKLFANVTKTNSQAVTGQCMSGGHEMMKIVPSRWQWRRCKDLLHFYICLGVIPITALIFYANVFIGPSDLKPIPEGYTPKHWEYHRSPITRFMARYMYPSPQQEYEKYLHLLYEEDEKMKIRQLERRIRDFMSERKDYQAYYYVPIEGKYHRITRKDAEEMENIAGWHLPRRGP